MALPTKPAFVHALLKNLGHTVPTDAELDDAFKKAFAEVKKAHGVDPDDVKYLINLTPVERGWVNKTF